MNTIHPLSWSWLSNLHLRSAMKKTNTQLDGAYLADFRLGQELLITELVSLMSVNTLLLLAFAFKLI